MASIGEEAMMSAGGRGEIREGIRGLGDWGIGGLGVVEEFNGCSWARRNLATAAMAAMAARAAMAAI